MWGGGGGGGICKCSLSNIISFSVHITLLRLQLLTYRIVNFTKDGIPNYVQRRIFSDALRLWESAAGIEIRECSQCLYADILISFVTRKHGDYYPFDGEGGTLAHAFYPLTNKGKSQPWRHPLTNLVPGDFPLLKWRPGVEVLLNVTQSPPPPPTPPNGMQDCSCSGVSSPAILNVEKALGLCYSSPYSPLLLTFFFNFIRSNCAPILAPSR